MIQIISGTSKTVSGTQNLERKVPNTAHKNVPTNSVLLGTLFQLAFSVMMMQEGGSIHSFSTFFMIRLYQNENYNFNNVASTGKP